MCKYLEVCQGVGGMVRIGIERDTKAKTLSFLQGKYKFMQGEEP